MRRLAALACATVLLLAACGDTGTPGGGTDRGLEGTEDLDPTPQGEGVDAGSDDEPYQCVQVSEAPGGEYIVGDGGTVEVTREDDGLVLGDVSANEGWTDEVVEESDQRVEVRFVPEEEGDMTIALVASDTAGVAETEGDVRVELCTRVN